MLSTADLARAIEIVRPVIPVTASFEWPLIAEAVGARVWLKHENHGPVGAFKLRGGLVYVEALRRRRPEVTRIVSATRGNHGQSLAFAGVRAGLAVTIVVPHGNSTEKNDAMRALGADLVVQGRDFQESREHAATLAAADPHTELVPSFHPDLVLGVATYAAELFEQAGPLDRVYVPIGMGSGICGLIAVRDLLGLPTRIIGVVSDRADATLRSFEAGGVVTTDSADTFVDGVATRSPDPEAVARIVAGASAIVAVSDDAVAEAMRLIMRCTHNLPEPAGAIALAGLIADGPHAPTARLAAILSGGNVDAPVLADVLAGRTPKP